jgi:hypothetical protein
MWLPQPLTSIYAYLVQIFISPRADEGLSLSMHCPRASVVSETGTSIAKPSAMQLGTSHHIVPITISCLKKKGGCGVHSQLAPDKAANLNIVLFVGLFAAPPPFTGPISKNIQKYRKAANSMLLDIAVGIPCAGLSENRSGIFREEDVQCC